MWFARVPHRTVLSVTGADAAKFLNGHVSTSIASTSRTPLYTSFIQGRVISEAFVHPHPTDPTGFLIEHDARESEAPPLSAMLKRFVLRSKVKVAPVGEEWDVWAAWGSPIPPAERLWKWSRSGCIEPVYADGVSPWDAGRSVTLIDRRGPGLGKRMLVRKNDAPPEAADHDEVAADKYTLHRILNGVAEGVTEVVPLHALPMESNLDIMGAVDFRKGCYVGQELTVRTYHTGSLRKRILPVRIRGAEPATPMPPVGVDIRLAVPPALEHELEEEGVKKPRPRPTGKLLAAVPHNGGVVGLALLRLEHLDSVERGELNLTVGNEDGANWTICHRWPEWFPKKGVDEVPSEDD